MRFSPPGGWSMGALPEVSLLRRSGGTQAASRFFFGLSLLGLSFLFAAARMSKGEMCPMGDSSLRRSESLVVVRGCLRGEVSQGRLSPGEIGARRVAGDWRVVGRFFPLESLCGKRCLRGRCVPRETLSWGDLTCEGASFGETWLGVCDGDDALSGGLS
jgi:hypothetical protein